MRTGEVTARSPTVHNPQAGERSRFRSAATLAQVGQKLIGTAATTSMCAQKASRNIAQMTSAVRLAAMHNASVRVGRLHADRRHSAIVIATQATMANRNIQRCGPSGFTAA